MRVHVKHSANVFVNIDAATNFATKRSTNSATT